MLAFADQGGDVVDGGLGCVVFFGFCGGTEGVYCGADVSKGCSNAGGDSFELLFCEVWVGVDGGSCCGGLDGDAAEVVGGGVVEFAGDACAFFSDEGLLLGFGEFLVVVDEVADECADAYFDDSADCCCANGGDAGKLRGEAGGECVGGCGGGCCECGYGDEGA